MSQHETDERNGAAVAGVTEGATGSVTVTQTGGAAGAPGAVAVAGGLGAVDLDAIARAASREAGGVPPDLLASYLPAAADAARTGRRLSTVELAQYGRAGERAA